MKVQTKVSLWGKRKIAFNANRRQAISRPTGKYRFNLHATLYTQTINNLIPNSSHFENRENIFSQDFLGFFSFSPVLHD
jgi:hypothetical protein